jgi:hypothetical protein
MHGEAIGSITFGFAPPGKLIAHGIAIDCPSASVRTFAVLIKQAKANRVILAPTPIAPAGFFSRPCTLKRKFLDSSAIKRLSLLRRVGKQTER